MLTMRLCKDFPNYEKGLPFLKLKYQIYLLEMCMNQLNGKIKSNFFIYSKCVLLTHENMCDQQ